MAENKKISELEPLERITGSEKIAVSIDGKNYKTTPDQMFKPGYGLALDGERKLNINLDLSVFTVVDELPDAPVEGDENKIHLVPSELTEAGNVFAEYVYVRGEWEKLGDFHVPSVFGLNIENVPNVISSITSKIDDRPNTVKGNFSFSYGRANTSNGEFSYSFGYGNTVDSWAFAFGYFSKANNAYTIALGNNCESNNRSEVSLGQYNRSRKKSDNYGDENTAFSIGIGTGNLEKKNAQEVMQNGDFYVYGIGGYDGTNPYDAKSLQEVIQSIVTPPASLDSVSRDEFNALKAELTALKEKMKADVVSEKSTM